MSVDVQPLQADGRPFPESLEPGPPCEACAGGWCQPGWCQDGRELVLKSEAPTANFANASTRFLLATVGVDAGPHLCGIISPEEVVGALEECEIAIGNSAAALIRRAPMLQDACEIRGSRGARWIDPGVSDARAADQLKRLRTVLAFAASRGLAVAWG